MGRSLFFCFVWRWRLLTARSQSNWKPWNDLLPIWFISFLNILLFRFSANIVRCYVSIPQSTLPNDFGPRLSFLFSRQRRDANNMTTMLTFFLLLYLWFPRSVSLGQDYVCVCDRKGDRSHTLAIKKLLAKGRIETRREEKRVDREWKVVSPTCPSDPFPHTQKETRTQTIGVKRFPLFFFLRESFVFGGRGRSDRPLFLEWRLTTGSVVIDIQSIEENKIEMDDRPYVWISTCNCH